MPCTGKGGSSSCSCKVFETGDADTGPSSKCTLCKHKKKYHTAAIAVSDVLAKFDLARLQSKKVADDQARRETNKGFRGGKSSDTAKASRSTSSSKAAVETNSMVKVGSIQIIICSVDAAGKPLVDRCPSPKVVEEDMVGHNLAVFKSPDGQDLEFDLDWIFGNVDEWLRSMVKKKGECSVFDYLDAKYGVPKGESDSHWVLAGKSSRKIFVKLGPINGELLDRVKGTASGHREYQEHAVRIITRHRIPSTLAKDWTEAVRRVTEGEELNSESEREVEQRSKSRQSIGKGKSRAKSKPIPRARSASVEAESSESDSSASKMELTIAGPRRSSRLAETAVKTESFDVDLGIPRSPSSPSGRSNPLFIDSDIEEIAAAEAPGSRKRSVSPSFLNEDIEDRQKRARSASYGSNYSQDSVKSDSDAMILQPAAFDVPPQVTLTAPPVTAATANSPNFSTNAATFSAVATPSTSTSAGSSRIPSSGSETTGPSTTMRNYLPRKGLHVPQSNSNIWQKF
ncbi:hypothetical protein B0H19DRAFT_1265770 [Mycena capillaripes]|nr:hypothetical protein B0H19DRAFT_1265770 [Mycena capillaripes]